MIQYDGIHTDISGPSLFANNVLSSVGCMLLGEGRLNDLSFGRQEPFSSCFKNVFFSIGDLSFFLFSSVPKTPSL